MLFFIKFFILFILFFLPCRLALLFSKKSHFLLHFFFFAPSKQGCFPPLLCHPPALLFLLFCYLFFAFKIYYSDHHGRPTLLPLNLHCCPLLLVWWCQFASLFLLSSFLFFPNFCCFFIAILLLFLAFEIIFFSAKKFLLVPPQISHFLSSFVMVCRPFVQHLCCCIFCYCCKFIVVFSSILLYLK
ncbi:hypothetical protein ES332_A04G085500v1 [Gossypium tomentosum]|uniref:Uncharacterized protein n=1 Tax=Gossypium tomentosum TaxID=34277 RepID=A0A5D2QZ58_GOSTO|nr:hypothetical protein ES332_A04G085500v1 [Gossypium tomentosum]